MTKWGTIVAAPTALAVWLVGAFIFGPSAPVAFAGVLEPVVVGTADAAAVHYVLHRLTREGEDFSFVDLDGPGLTVDVWVEAPRLQDEPVRFRKGKAIEARVVEDGDRRVQLSLREDPAAAQNAWRQHAAKASGGSSFGTLGDLLGGLNLPKK